MEYYNTYIILIFIVKICFLLLAVTNIYLKFKKQSNTTLDKQIIYWKDRVEFIFSILMAFLLIYLFYPFQSKNIIINGETQVLLYLFGFVILITAKWGNFIKEATWFKDIQQSV